MERYKVKTSRSTRQDWADLVPRFSRKSTKDTEEQRRRRFHSPESGKRKAEAGQGRGRRCSLSDMQFADG